MLVSFVPTLCTLLNPTNCGIVRVLPHMFCVIFIILHVMIEIWAKLIMEVTRSRGIH